MTHFGATAARTLAWATTAVTAGYAGAASASLTSEVPAGYVPLTFQPGSAAHGSFDLSGAGFAPIIVSGQDAIQANKSAKLSVGSTTPGVVFAIDGFLSTISAMPAPFVVDPASGSSSGFLVNGKSKFSDTPAFAAVQFSENGAVTNGYFEGTYDGSTFTLLDYGVLGDTAAVADTAVPEPASLALLATGAAGIAALRRRRAAR